MADYEALARADFLPGLAGQSLAAKADRLQALIERGFYHPDGLFYSLLLIDPPEGVRPMSPADLQGVNDSTDAYDGATQEAARDEGMTFENSIASAGLYLQAQSARHRAGGDSRALDEAGRAFHSLWLIYRHGCEHGRAGWLGKPYGRIPKDHSTADQYHMALIGLHRYRQVAPRDVRARIDGMLVDIADFMRRRDYQIWDLSKPTDGITWGHLQHAYCNATYVLSQVLAYDATGEARYRDEAFRLGALSPWRDQTYLDEWRAQGLARMLYFERICLGYFVPAAGEVIHELLPEFYGDSPDQARDRFARMVARWWAFSQLGIDGDACAHYWVDVDVRAGTWRPTGVRPVDPPYGWGGTFMAYYSDVRMGDVAYRTLNTAFLQGLYGDGEREAPLRWARRALELTDGHRLRWMIDPDGRQLKPDIRWMECILSSEAPFHFLAAYWRGRERGLW
jgi:hypothetical protein